MEKWYRYLILSLMLFSCGSDSGVSNSTYQSQMQALAGEETEIIALYESVTGSNYTTDSAVRRVVNDQIIPKTRSFIAKIEAIVPSKDLRSVHEQYISAWNLQYDAFVLIVAAIDQQDATLVVEANQKLTQARTIIRNIQFQLTG